MCCLICIAPYVLHSNLPRIHPAVSVMTELSPSPATWGCLCPLFPMMGSPGGSSAMDKLPLYPGTAKDRLMPLGSRRLSALGPMALGFDGDEGCRL